MGGQGSGKLSKDVAMVRLDGHKIYEDGKIEKTDILDFLQTDISDYSNFAITAEEFIKLRNHVHKMKYGISATMPRYCTGNKCKDRTCPLHDAVQKGTAQYPLAKQCYLEAKFIQTKMASYMEEFSTDPESATEMTLINELISLDIQELRVNIGLSGSVDEDAAYLLHKNIIDNGQSLQEQTVIHPLVEIKDKISKRKQSLLEAMVATPREKYKKAAALKTSDDQDLSSFFGKLSDKFSKDVKATESKQINEDLDKIIDEVADIDENIIEAEWKEK